MPLKQLLKAALGLPVFVEDGVNLLLRAKADAARAGAFAGLSVSLLELGSVPA